MNESQVAIQSLPDSPIGAPISVRTKADRDATDADLAAMRAESDLTPEDVALLAPGVLGALRAAIAASPARRDEAAA